MKNTVSSICNAIKFEFLVSQQLSMIETICYDHKQQHFIQTTRVGFDVNLINFRLCYDLGQEYRLKGSAHLKK